MQGTEAREGDDGEQWFPVDGIACALCKTQRNAAMSSAHTFSRTSQSQRRRLRVPGVLAPPALERGYWVLPGKLRKSFSDRTM